ncbi:MAG: hypothetical protein Q7R50_02085, partial [Dehalococcoidales bacterium]|nr:hypothetical protein [Dehalococcoidales bacterium]
MQKNYRLCAILVLVGLTSCAPAVPVQPIITDTPSNTTATAPTITPAANQTTYTSSNISAPPPVITPVEGPTDYTLNVIVSPPGSGSVSPSTGNYTYGTNATFIAIPADGYVFQYWSYDFTVYNGGGGGYLGDNHILNFAVERSENVTAHFVAPPSIWNNALFYSQAQRKVAPGEYFIISQDYIAGQFGPESLNATFNESLIALIDRKDAGINNGPITPGMHSSTAWLLFTAAHDESDAKRNGMTNSTESFSFIANSPLLGFPISPRGESTSPHLFPT